MRDTWTADGGTGDIVTTRAVVVLASAATLTLLVAGRLSGIGMVLGWCAGLILAAVAVRGAWRPVSRRGPDRLPARRSPPATPPVGASPASPSARS